MGETTVYANSVFEQPWWLDTVAEGKWGEAVVKDGDQVIARLPYVLDRGVIKNPRYTQTLGIWMDDSLKAYQRGNSQLHRQKEVIAELLSQLPEHKSMNVIYDSAFEYVLPFRWQGFRIEPTFSYRIDDLQDSEEILSNMGKTVLKNLKSAGKKLSVETDSKDIDTLIRLQDMSFARQNRKNPMPSELTRKVVEHAFAKNAGRLMITYDSTGVAHSAAFFLFDDKVCYYLMGGQNPDFKSDGSQNLILKEGIDFAAIVSESFDFEGSMVEGIENFFRQFGGKQIINWHVSRQSVFSEVRDVLKPHVKRILGYKI